MKFTIMAATGVALLLLLPIPARAGEEAVAVGMKPLATLLIHPEREVPGEVVALQRSRVSAQLGAVVGEVLVETGAVVAQEQLLARQDCWEQREQAARAEAEVLVLQSESALARRQKERARMLHQQGQTPRETLERREAELLTLEARLHSQEVASQTARVRLDKCDIRAPFAGVVLSREARNGEWAAAGTPLFELVDPQSVELAAQLEPGVDQELPLMKESHFIQETARHPVQLRVLLPALDRATRTREGRFTFTATRPLPGSAGRLHWRDPRPHLPAWLLVRRQEILGVFLVQENTARFHPLPHAQEGRPVVWSASPSDGQVVVEGREGLREGQKVRESVSP